MSFLNAFGFPQTGSVNKSVSNTDAHVMLRAVTHLTVVLAVVNEIGNEEEKKEFFWQLTEYAKVYDLR